MDHISVWQQFGCKFPWTGDRTPFPHLKVTVNPCDVNFLFNSRLSRVSAEHCQKYLPNEWQNHNIFFFLWNWSAVFITHNKCTYTHNDTLPSWQILSESFARKWFWCWSALLILSSIWNQKKNTLVSQCMHYLLLFTPKRVPSNLFFLWRINLLVWCPWVEKMKGNEGLEWWKRFFRPAFWFLASCIHGFEKN